MARIARVVAVGYPHHIIQRGNRRQKVFFKDNDRLLYLKLLKEHKDLYGLEYWAYCLMDNHVHLVAVPNKADSFQAFAKTNWQYTKAINEYHGWKGYLWQGRFLSYPMDEGYCFLGVRYVERNPVRAGIVKRAEDYPWSSARSHVYGKKDGLVARCYLQDDIKDWSEYLRMDDEKVKELRKSIGTGRPLGTETFLRILEEKIGRILIKQKPGRKPKELSCVSP
jgi:putative transposase